MNYEYTKPDPEACHVWRFTQQEIKDLLLQHIRDCYGPIPAGSVALWHPRDGNNDYTTIRILSTDAVERKKEGEE